MAAISLSDSRTALTRPRETRGQSEAMTLNGLERRPGAPPDRPLTRSGGKMAGRKTGARLSWALVAAVGWLSPQRHARSIVVACLKRSRIFSPVSPQYLPYVSPISPGLPPAQSGLWATRDSRCDSREGRDGRATT